MNQDNNVDANAIFNGNLSSDDNTVNQINNDAVISVDNQNEGVPIGEENKIETNGDVKPKADLNYVNDNDNVIMEEKTNDSTDVNQNESISAIENAKTEIIEDVKSEANLGTVSESSVKEEVPLVEDNKKKKKDLKIDNSFKGMYNYLITRNTKDLLLLLARLLIIAGIIFVLKIPVDTLNEMIYSFLDLFDIIVPDNIKHIIDFIFKFGYGLFSVILFYIVVTTRFDSLLKLNDIEEE